MVNKLYDWLVKTRVNDPGLYKVLKMMVVPVILFIFYVIGLLMQTWDHLLDFDYKFTYNPFVCWSYSLGSIKAWCVFGIIVGVGLLLLVILKPKENTGLEIAEMSEDGVIRLERGSYGRAHKVGIDEASKYYCVGEAKDAENFIFGQYDLEGHETVSIKLDVKDDNQTIILIGAPGTGKSASYIRPAILQAVKKGESFVVTDPKGELFESLSKTVESHGYVTKLFNLVDPEHSDSWACIDQCFDVNGDAKSERIDSFCEVLISNSSDPLHKGDKFYEDGEKNLLKMHVHYVVGTYMRYVNDRYSKTVRSLLENIDETPDVSKIPYVNEVYHKWRYSDELKQVMRYVQMQRNPSTGMTYTSEERQNTLKLLDQCLEEDNFYTAEGRNRIRTRIEDLFTELEVGEFIPCMVQKYIAHLCDSNDELWHCNKKNLLSWCKNYEGGFRDETRVSKRKILRELMLYSGATPIETEEVVDTIENGEQTPKCTMAEIYARVRDTTLEGLDNDFQNIENSDPGKSAYIGFKKATQVTQTSWLQGLNMRMSIFASEDIRALVSNSDINFKELGERKTAIFIKLSDGENPYKLITSMFFNCMLDDIKETFDSCLQKEKRIPIKMIFDEFANVGVIPNIPKYMNQMRGRLTNFVICLQRLNQLDEHYGPAAAANIFGSTEYVIYLGSNDMDTAEYISQRAGVQTIMVGTEKENISGIGLDSRLRAMQKSVGEGKRNVYNIDEVQTLQKRTAIVIRMNVYAMELNTFFWKNHPMANKGNLPTFNTTQYMSIQEKYPFYRYCVDPLTKNDMQIKEIKKQKNIHLPDVNIPERIMELKRRKDERLNAKDPMTDMDSIMVVYPEIETTETEEMNPEMNLFSSESQVDTDEETLPIMDIVTEEVVQSEPVEELHPVNDIVTEEEVSIIQEETIILDEKEEAISQKDHEPESENPMSGPAKAFVYDKKRRSGRNGKSDLQDREDKKPEKQNNFKPTITGYMAGIDNKFKTALEESEEN